MALRLNLNKFLVQLTGYSYRSLSNESTVVSFLFKGFNDKNEISRLLKDKHFIDAITTNAFYAVSEIKIYDESDMKSSDKDINSFVTSIVIKDSMSGHIAMLPDAYRQTNVFSYENSLVLRAKPSGLIDNEESNIIPIELFESIVKYPFVTECNRWILDYDFIMNNDSFMLNDVICGSLKYTGIHHFAIDMHLLNMHEITMLLQKFSKDSEYVKNFKSCSFYMSGKPNTISDAIYEIPYLNYNEAVVLNRIFPFSYASTSFMTPITRVWE